MTALAFLAAWPLASFAVAALIALRSPRRRLTREQLFPELHGGPHAD